MIFSQIILFSLFYSFQTLVLDRSIYIPKSHLPIYDEYLNEITTPEPEIQKALESEDPTVINPLLPAIQLCKEPQNNFYGHAYCVAMLILFALATLALIIYLLRSIGILVTKETRFEQYTVENLTPIVNKSGVDEPDFVRNGKRFNK